MTLAVAEALGPNELNLDMTLAVAEALSPNELNLDMTLDVAEALSPNNQSSQQSLNDLRVRTFLSRHRHVYIARRNATPHTVMAVSLMTPTHADFYLGGRLSHGRRISALT